MLVCYLRRSKKQSRNVAICVFSTTQQQIPTRAPGGELMLSKQSQNGFVLALIVVSM